MQVTVKLLPGIYTGTGNQRISSTLQCPIQITSYNDTEKSEIILTDTFFDHTMDSATSISIDSVTLTIQEVLYPVIAWGNGTQDNFSFNNVDITGNGTLPVHMFNILATNATFEQTTFSYLHSLRSEIYVNSVSFSQCSFEHIFGGNALFSVNTTRFEIDTLEITNCTFKTFTKLDEITFTSFNNIHIDTSNIAQTLIKMNESFTDIIANNLVVSNSRLGSFIQADLYLDRFLYSDISNGTMVPVATTLGSTGSTGTRTIVIDGMFFTNFDCSEILQFSTGLELFSLSNVNLSDGTFEIIVSPSKVHNIDLLSVEYVLLENITLIDIIHSKNIININARGVTMRNIMIQNFETLSAETPYFSFYSDIAKGSLSMVNCSFSAGILSGDMNTPYTTTLINPLFYMENYNEIIISQLSMENVNMSILHVERCAAVTLTDTDVTNCAILFNHAIFLLNIGQLTISNLNFAFNQVNGPFAIIEISNAAGSMSDSTIENNGNINRTGSTIFLQNTIFSFTDTIFRNCSASSGGAIDALLANLNITNSNFENCAATSGVGGAILVDSSTVNLSHCSIANCSSEQNGGGMYASNSTIFAVSSNFTRNQGQRYGGGLFFTDQLRANPSTFTECLFSENSALQGAAASISNVANVTFTDSLFTQNYAYSIGGGVVTTGFSTLTLYNSLFSENTADSAGGALYVLQQSDVTLQYTNFTYNMASIAGGAINIQDRGVVDLNFCVLAFNGAENVGSILSSTLENLTISNCVIEENTATSTGGGVIGHSTGNLDVTSSIFRANIALSGSGIWVDNYLTLNIYDSLFENNIAKSNGGAILMGDTSSGQISNTTFRNNTAIFTGGGSIAVRDQASPVISNCSFIKNSGAYGGALLSTSSDGPYVVNSTFQENKSKFSGGAIAFQQCAASLRDCDCIENYSSYHGGCLAAIDGSTATITNLFIYNNSAVQNGGALYFLENAVAYITDTIIQNNSGDAGGGTYMDFDTDGTSTNCSYISNIADNGGAVYDRGAVHQFIDTIFHKNKGSVGGGAITFSLNTLNVTAEKPIFISSVFSENEAVRGGAMYLLPARVVNNVFSQEITLASDSVFDSNSAPSEGGAIYIASGAYPPNFSRCNFTNNLSKKLGGSLFVASLYDTPAPWVANATFENNTALWAGATIFWNFLPNTNEAYTYSIHSQVHDNLTIGYQNSFGEATYPVSMVLTSPCPTSVTLDQTPFTVSVNVQDQLGTPVVGNMLSDDSFVAVLTTGGENCQKSVLVAPVDGLTGIATFEGVALAGKNNASCLLDISMTANNISNIPIESVSCSVLLYNCKSTDGSQERIVKGTDIDSCKTMIISTTEFLYLIIIALVVSIMSILCIILFFYYRKHKRRVERQRELEPLFNERPAVTIETILNDPGIPRVHWHDITRGSQIGVGASGVVSKGIWHHDGQDIPVAMKELLVGLDLLDESVINEFLVEIKFMSALNHPNIVQFLGICCPKPTTIYLVTELMELGSVKALIEERPNMEYKERIELMIGAAKGIEYLHNNKLIHRDIKPHNLLVNANMECKIADFGISTVMPEFTRTMTCVGTPVYMAPEVLSLEKYSAKADVYSFGILLLELITNLRPYSIGEAAGLSNPVLAYQIIEKGLRPEHGPLPEPLQQLIDECIDGKPDFRPSFNEIIKRLERLKSLDVDIFDILMYSRKLEQEQQELEREQLMKRVSRRSVSEP